MLALAVKISKINAPEMTKSSFSVTPLSFPHEPYTT